MIFHLFSFHFFCSRSLTSQSSGQRHQHLSFSGLWLAPPNSNLQSPNSSQVFFLIFLSFLSPENFNIFRRNNHHLVLPSVRFFPKYIFQNRNLPTPILRIFVYAFSLNTSVELLHIRTVAQTEISGSILFSM